MSPPPWVVLVAPPLHTPRPGASSDVTLSSSLHLPSGPTCDFIQLQPDPTPLAPFCQAHGLSSLVSPEGPNFLFNFLLSLFTSWTLSPLKLPGRWPAVSSSSRASLPSGLGAAGLGSHRSGADRLAGSSPLVPAALTPKASAPGYSAQGLFPMTRLTPLGLRSPESPGLCPA